MDLKQHIGHVPDFPKAGILFYDITTLLRNPAGFEATIDRLSRAVLEVSDRSRRRNREPWLHPRRPVARRLGAGFVPIRKPGKLPAKARKETYELEYGTDALEIHEDAMQRGQRVLIVDDVLATGGTAAAAARLVKHLGGELQGLAFLIELLVPERAGQAAGRERLFGAAVLTGNSQGLANRTSIDWELGVSYNAEKVPVAQLDRARAS